MATGGSDGHAHWFEPLARFLGPAYERYSFTKGTAREVASLIELLGLEPGHRVLDVGCGPGRHALALAAAGFDVVGVDISADFVALATDRAVTAGLADRARFTVADARRLGYEAEFDAVISLCQGAFGLSGGPGSRPGQAPDHRELDEPILAGMARALRPGGAVAVSAFSAYFQLRHLEEHDTFDAETGVNHEPTVLRNEAGEERPAELWTTCYTPRELRLLARAVGLAVVDVHSVSPGHYRPRTPTIDTPELLLIATRPRSTGPPLPQVR